MSAGQQIRLIVDDLDQDGAGVGTVADPRLEVHVPGTLPGEEVSARVEGVSTHRPVAWATLGTIHRLSDARVSPTCAAHGRCGGCVLQHLNLDAQMRWKEAWLAQLVARQPAVATTSLRPVVASPRAVGYRNNAKLIPAYTGTDSLVLGAYARRTHDVVNLAGCTITEPALEFVAAALRDILQAEAVRPYDEVGLTGLLRYVVMRANAEGQVLVTLVTASDDFPAGTRVAEFLRAREPRVVGVVQNVNPARGNAIYGPVERPLAGVPTIDDHIGAVRLRISSRAFFQANRDVARAAYTQIAQSANLTTSDRVVDAYAGVGGIALTLAPHAHSVIGIEEIPAAVQNATDNAILNDITNAKFVAGDVSTCLGAIGSADVVVLNPPRKGCAIPVLRQVAALQPRTIAYLSCAPDTLLRDLAILASHGFRTDELTPFDMLPHTTHLETLAILSRA